MPVEDSDNHNHNKFTQTTYIKYIEFAHITVSDIRKIKKHQTDNYLVISSIHRRLLAVTP